MKGEVTLQLIGLFLIFGPLFISLANSNDRRWPYTETVFIGVCWIASLAIGIGVCWLTSLLLIYIAPFTGLAAYWYAYYRMEETFRNVMKGPELSQGCRQQRAEAKKNVVAPSREALKKVENQKTSPQWTLTPSPEQPRLPFALDADVKQTGKTANVVGRNTTKKPPLSKSLPAKPQARTVNRPFFNKGTKELVALFTQAKAESDRALLEELNHELSFRKRPQSVDLAKRVQAELSRFVEQK